MADLFFRGRNIVTALSFQNVLPPAIVLVDGLTRSGKSMLGPILSSFERVEIERLEPDLEWIGDMDYLRKIEREAAVAFLRLAVNRLFYEGLIGRNANFRFGDHSSVWQAPRPWPYLRRLVVDERLSLAERVAREQPIFQNMVHHQLLNFGLYHEAFGDRLRMVEMIRDPVDLVDSWMRKRKGELIGHDPLISMVFVSWNGHDLPWYVCGWEEEYLAAAPLDRVIRMIATKWRLSINALRKLTPAERARLVILPLEEFVQRPEAYIARLAAFIGTRPTRRTPAALHKQRCPRHYDRRKRDALLLQFTREAGAVARGALEEMVNEHSVVTQEMAG